MRDRFRDPSIAPRALTLGIALLALTPGAALATFPGANGRIAYHSYSPPSGLHTILADGTGDQFIANRGFKPAWSPSGADIAFIHAPPYIDKPGPNFLFTAAADGSQSRLLTRARGYPSYSPSGRRIAFVRNDAGADPHIYTIKPNGSAKQRIATGTNPIYSPTRNEIVFIMPPGPGVDQGLWQSDRICAAQGQNRQAQVLHRARRRWAGSPPRALRWAH